MNYRALVAITIAGTVLFHCAAYNSGKHEHDPENPLSLSCHPRNSFFTRNDAVTRSLGFSQRLKESNRQLSNAIVSSNVRIVSDPGAAGKHDFRLSIPKHGSASGPCRLEGVKEMYNFAAFSAGAQVLSSSPGMKGAEKTLITDSDKYMSTLCSLQSKWFVIQLSEDVEVSAISITNLEHYSSGVEYFQLLGSDKHPTPEWILMGYFRAENSMNEQIFCMERKIPVRYLKIRLLSHYGNEQYCTLNSVKVYGSRLLEALGRALDETFHDSRKTLDEIAEAGSDLKEAKNALHSDGSENKHQFNSLAKSTESVQHPEANVDANAERNQRSVSNKEQINAKSAAEKSPLPHKAAPSSSGPQNVIIKLTNRIKDLEINQTLANHALEKLSRSVTSTVEKLESAILSMETVLVARDKSIQTLLASAVETTNASTITILLLRRQLAALNSAYESADSTLKMLRFALAIALITICAGIVAALFKTSSGPIYQPLSFQTPAISATPATQRRRRRIRSGRLSKVRSLDLTEIDRSYLMSDGPKNDDSINFRPALMSPIAADDSGISYSRTPIRYCSQPFLSSNKFGPLLDENNSD